MAGAIAQQALQTHVVFLTRVTEQNNTLFLGLEAKAPGIGDGFWAEGFRGVRPFWILDCRSWM